MVEMSRQFKDLFTHSKEKGSKLLGFAKTLLKVCASLCACVCCVCVVCMHVCMCTCVCCVCVCVT